MFIRCSYQMDFFVCAHIWRPGVGVMVFVSTGLRCRQFIIISGAIAMAIYLHSGGTAE